MTTVIASFNVSDYDSWRAGYAHAVGDPKLLSWRIWRGQDDPNHVLNNIDLTARNSYYYNPYYASYYASDEERKPGKGSVKKLKVKNEERGLRTEKTDLFGRR